MKTNRSGSRTVIAAFAVCSLLAQLRATGERQQPPAERLPSATLIPAQLVTFGSSADSNSPALWERVNGILRLFVFTSFAGRPTRNFGGQMATLVPTGWVQYQDPAPPHGVWMEAIIPDADGTWYGYYHNELPATVCDETTRTMPRIGAARSRDFGATWEDLGVILEAPRGWHDCDSLNRYFVGGVGDFSAILDHDQKDVYFFFSQYGDREQTQGVAVGRMAWANRDEPQGRVSVWWHGSTWIPTRRIGWHSEDVRYIYPAGVPIYRAANEWHDDRVVDAFWGPSVHWNTYLEQYVMLLNHAQDTEWRQEGVYVAFSPSLSNPAGWSTPKRLLTGGTWYPQVMGTEIGVGTDKIAGERARFFLGGRSQYFIQFAR